MWSSQLMRPLPALREVHFWCVFPEEVDGVLLKSYEKLLPPEELVEIPNARTQKMQTGRLLARTLVRSTLARYTNGAVDPAALRFRKNSYGKPEVIWPRLTTGGKLWKPPRLSFNLSHTTSLVACGVALDSAVGVDVEEKDRKLSTKLMTFARKKLASREADCLQHITDTQEQHHRFMQLWTLKESYAKAVGKGISGVPFKEFAFGLTTSPVAREFLTTVLNLPADSQAELITLDLARSVAEREKAASCWKFVLFEPSPAHVASICVEDKVDDTNLNAQPFQVKAWKTVPLSSDQTLYEGREVAAREFEFRACLMAASRLKVALFECERLHEHLAPSVYKRTGGYQSLLQRAFDHFSDSSTESSPLPSLELTAFDVKAEKYPADVQKFAGVLISGSLSGVYDDEPWISRLLQEIRVLDSMKVKTCGISFGHQAIAQALGGRVGKNPKGSEVSVRVAKLTRAAQQLFGTERKDFRLHYHHNDAILQLPDEFKVLASNNVTQYQSIYKPSHFLTFCGHPDYSHTVEVLEKLLQYDREKLWVHEQLVELGQETLQQPTDYLWVLQQIVRFYAGAGMG